MKEEGKVFSPEVLLGGCFKFGGMQERRCHTKGTGPWLTEGD